MRRRENHLRVLQNVASSEKHLASQIVARITPNTSLKSKRVEGDAYNCEQVITSLHVMLSQMCF